jgi:hypothetical protein
VDPCQVVTTETRVSDGDSPEDELANRRAPQPAGQKQDAWAAVESPLGTIGSAVILVEDTMGHRPTPRPVTPVELFHVFVAVGAGEDDRFGLVGEVEAVIASFPRAKA